MYAGTRGTGKGLPESAGICGKGRGAVLLYYGAIMKEMTESGRVLRHPGDPVLSAKDIPNPAGLIFNAGFYRTLLPSLLSGPAKQTVFPLVVKVELYAFHRLCPSASCAPVPMVSV